MQSRPPSQHLAHLAPIPGHAAVRKCAAAALHAAGCALQHLGRRLSEAPAGVPTVGQAALLEFHAEAGAPEGALYVNGQLAAHLGGVHRL